MHILLVTMTYPPYVSGVATATANLADELSKHHQVEIVTAHSRKTIKQCQINPGLTVHYLPGINISKPRALTIPYPHLKTVEKIIAAFHPQVIHLQDFGPISLSSLVIANKLKIPVVMTHHFTAEFVLKTIIPTRQLSHRLSQNPSLKQLIYSLVNLIYNRCSLITVPNPNLIPYFKEAKIKVPIVNISNGIRTKFFQIKTNPRKVRDRYQITQTKIILFVGRLDVDKSLDLLVEAFSYVHLFHPDTALVFCGDGNQQKKLQKLSQKLKLNHCVYFLGKIPNNDQALSKLYHASHLLVNPSIIESQGVVFLEAMTAGLPIVAADNPLQLSLLQHHHNAVLFEANNQTSLALAIQQLLLDKKLYHQLAKNSQRQTRQFDISRTSQEYLRAYQSLLK